jgi:hypothetical protein
MKSRRNILCLWAVPYLYYSLTLLKTEFKTPCIVIDLSSFETIYNKLTSVPIRHSKFQKEKKLEYMYSTLIFEAE